MHISDCVIFNPVGKMNKIMQNKLVKDRKKLSIFCLFIFSYRNRLGLSLVIHSTDSVVFYQVKLKPACQATGDNQ